jgi:hypothetical protein
MKPVSRLSEIGPFSTMGDRGSDSNPNIICRDVNLIHNLEVLHIRSGVYSLCPKLKRGDRASSRLFYFLWISPSNFLAVKNHISPMNKGEYGFSREGVAVAESEISATCDLVSCSSHPPPFGHLPLTQGGGLSNLIWHLKQERSDMPTFPLSFQNSQSAGTKSATSCRIVETISSSLMRLIISPLR